MKLSIAAIALVGYSTLVAAKYAPGTKCHDNNECSQNCPFGRWTTLPDDNDRDVPACVLDAGDTVKYYYGSCSTVNIRDEKPAATACAAVGGTICANGCVVAGLLSANAETTAAWNKACRDAGGPTSVYYLYQRKDEADARKRAGCTS